MRNPRCLRAACGTAAGRACGWTCPSAPPTASSRARWLAGGGVRVRHGPLGLTCGRGPGMQLSVLTDRGSRWTATGLAMVHGRSAPPPPPLLSLVCTGLSHLLCCLGGGCAWRQSQRALHRGIRGRGRPAAPDAAHQPAAAGRVRHINRSAGRVGARRVRAEALSIHGGMQESRQLRCCACPSFRGPSPHAAAQARRGCLWWWRPGPSRRRRIASTSRWRRCWSTAPAAATACCCCWVPLWTPSTQPCGAACWTRRLTISSTHGCPASLRAVRPGLRCCTCARARAGGLGTWRRSSMAVMKASCYTGCRPGGPTGAGGGAAGGFLRRQPRGAGGAAALGAGRAPPPRVPAAAAVAAGVRG